MAAQQSDVQQILGDLPVASANVEVIAAPLREVPASLLRPIIRAMAESRRIDVDYVSLNNPDREGRIIVPHTSYGRVTGGTFALGARKIWIFEISY